MTPLRQRMIQDMQLRGFSARTQECYVAAVRQLAEHYHVSPDQLTEEHVRQCFLYLANEKKTSCASGTSGTSQRRRSAAFVPSEVSAL